MNEQELVTGAQEEVVNARKELARAREELNSFKADPQLPSYVQGTTATYFTFLTEQVDKRVTELKDREIALEKEREGASKKRKAGSTASSRGTGQLSQDSFRKRLLERDSSCVLTGKGKYECAACHIVPWVYFQKDDFIGKKIFDIVFPSSCDDPDHRIMDVRNGILMWHPLHTAFDKFYFTIIRSETSTDPTYIVKTLEEDVLKADGVDDDLINIINPLNGKVLQFNRNKPNERPGEKFLQFHNECFEAKKQLLLKAAADEYDSDYDDSNETVAVMAESIKKAHYWLGLDEDDDSCPALVSL